MGYEAPPKPRTDCDVFHAIGLRRSVRHFAQTPVPEEHLFALIDRARLAPSAGNLQPWFFYVVRNQGLRSSLAQAALNQRFVASAPVALVVCADLERTGARYRRRGVELYCLQDTAAATQTLLLAAAGLGLATCWVGAFDEGEVSRILDIPNHLRPVALIPLGYPSERPLEARERHRRPVEEICHFLD